MIDKIEIGKIYKFVLFDYDSVYRDDPADPNTKYISGPIELNEATYNMATMRLDKLYKYKDPNNIVTPEMAVIVIDLYRQSTTVYSAQLDKSRTEILTEEVIFLYNGKYYIFHEKFFKRITEEAV